RPSRAALPRIYPDSYYAYDFVAKAGGFVMRFKGMAERAKLDLYRRYLPDGGRALDVGCGDGHLLVQLAGERRASLELHGVEFSEAAVLAAEARGLVVHRGRIEDVSRPALQPLQPGVARAVHPGRARPPPAGVDVEPPDDRTAGSREMSPARMASGTPAPAALALPGGGWIANPGWDSTFFVGSLALGI